MIGFLIGRFQPFHLGHLEAIKFALSKVEHLHVGIGSSNKSHEKKNPFTADERKKMMLSSIDNELQKNLSIHYIPDVNDHSKWTHLVDEIIPEYDVVFTNDVFPRSKNFKEPERIIIEEGVSLGANSTILAGVKLGKYAMTGIGSVVTRNLKSHGLYYGNPAKQSGWIDEQGEKLEFDLQNKVWLSKNKSIYIESPDGLTNVESVVK